MRKMTQIQFDDLTSHITALVDEALDLESIPTSTLDGQVFEPIFDALADNIEVVDDGHIEVTANLGRREIHFAVPELEPFDGTSEDTREHILKNYREQFPNHDAATENYEVTNSCTIGFTVESGYYEIAFSW